MPRIGTHLITLSIITTLILLPFNFPYIFLAVLSLFSLSMLYMLIYHFISLTFDTFR